MREFRSKFTIDEINQEFIDVQELRSANEGRSPKLSDTASESGALRDELREAELMGARKDRYLTDAERAKRLVRKVPAAPRQASLDERAKRHERLHERGGRCFVCSGLELHQGGLL